MIRINLNSPDGNAFVLITNMVNLMTQAELDEVEIKNWIHEVTNLHYEELVEEVRKKCKELSELLDEEIEIYSSENYEMERL